jgi:hypothetical protein
MGNSDCYRVNGPNVVHEMIDGEIVIVNLAKGHYFSLLNTGAEIWEALLKGRSESEIVEALLRKYDGERQQIADAVGKMIAELEMEEIIVPGKPSENLEEHLLEDGASRKDPEKSAFMAPVIEKYTDMEELLLLDPIHEVDEAGWPNLSEQ